MHNIAWVFLEGIVLIFSPCILSILPIALAAGIEGGTRRPFGIILGFILGFTIFLFTPFLSISWANIDDTWFQQVAYGLLLLFGVILFSTKLSEEFGEIRQRMAVTGEDSAARGNSGFIGGIVIGILAGIIWVPFGSSILTRKGIQTGTQLPGMESFLIAMVFILGVGLSILIIILGARQAIIRLHFLHRYLSKIRKFSGILIILAVLGMSEWLLPVPTFLKNQTDLKIEKIDITNGLAEPYPAPEINGIDVWLNSSDTLPLKNQRGYVVLINFWSYSCINCLRILPHLSRWYTQYHDKGLKIISIHSPEFDFEKRLPNVVQALNKYDVEYPVALDNQLATWNAYQNKSRPAQYLIDQQGKVVYTHFGEGAYEVTENNIRVLLGLSKEIKKHQQTVLQTHFTRETEEIHLGYAQIMNFQSPQSPVLDMGQTYSYPHQLRLHHWALDGRWQFNRGWLTAKKAGARLKLHFFAKKIFLVIGKKSKKPAKLKVRFNGYIMEKNAGIDVQHGEILIKNNKVYELVSLPEAAMAEIELIAESPGIQLYTFTFG